MYNSIVRAECVNLDKLEHLFIDLEYTKQQNKGFNVYRSRSFNQKNKKYLQIDEIKEAISQINRNELKFIYLLGKNAMSHPEFNQILRLCLSFCSITIFSDGECINDKKARFLKRVEEEKTNEIIFKIFINHYDEKTNDAICGRGAYRKALHAITALNKYGFNPILVVKAQKENISELKEGFIELGNKFGFETEDLNFSFIPDTFTEKQFYKEENSPIPLNKNYDCMHSRTLSKSGVYNCPMLLNDYRGHSGATLKDFSPKCYLETGNCQICKNFGNKIYINNWE